MLNAYFWNKIFQIDMNSDLKEEPTWCRCRFTLIEPVMPGWYVWI